MKRGLLTLILTVTIGLAATAQQSLGQIVKAQNIDGVSTMTVGKPLFALLGAGSMGVGAMDGIKLDNIINKLDRIEVVTTEKKSAVKKLRKLIQPIFNDNNYEVLIDLKEDKEHSMIAIKERFDGNNEIVIISDEGKEITAVVFIGTITFEDLRSDPKADPLPDQMSAPSSESEPIVVGGEV